MMATLVALNRLAGALGMSERFEKSYETDSRLGVQRCWLPITITCARSIEEFATHSRAGTNRCSRCDRQRTLSRSQVRRSVPRLRCVESDPTKTRD